MKMTKKLGLLASVLVGAVAMIFTSCDPDLLRSFGKDDFYGTWNTLDFDESGNVQQYYEIDEGYKYVVQWIFDGKSEDMFAGNGTFKQVLRKYPKTAKTNENGAILETETPDAYTVWFGAYKITGNSDYSKGKLYLYYEIGLDLKTALAEDKDLTLETIVGAYDDKGKLKKNEDGSYVAEGWKIEDFLNYAWDNTDGKKNLEDGELAVADAYTGNSTKGYSEGSYYKTNKAGVTTTVQIRKVGSKVLCSDIEYFRYNLKDPATSGYSRMMASAHDKNGSTIIGATYDQWIEKSADNTKTFGKRTTYGYKVREGCSWNGTNERYFGRISVADKDQNGIKDDFLYSDSSTNASLFKLADAEDDMTYTVGADELEE